MHQRCRCRVIARWGRTGGFRTSPFGTRTGPLPAWLLLWEPARKVAAAVQNAMHLPPLLQARSHLCRREDALTSSRRPSFSISSAAMPRNLRPPATCSAMACVAPVKAGALLDGAAAALPWPTELPPAPAHDSQRAIERCWRAMPHSVQAQ